MSKKLEKQHEKQQIRSQILQQLVQQNSNKFPEQFYKQTQSQIHFLQNKQSYKSLMRSKRFYKKSIWALQIEENCLDTDFQSMSIQLHYGPYATKINTISLQTIHEFNEADRIGCGNFGNIYQMRLANHKYTAIKAIKLNDNQLNLSWIKNIYSEYFIALIASQLAVGPLLINIFGYDIVFLKNFALFGMQLCQKGFLAYKNLNIYQSVQESLKTLHSLHIVHRDVKPQNIIWSHHFQKYILIDFGKENQETLTGFAGTYSYCSHQMQKCLILNKMRLVNLYYNDKFSLSKCKNMLLFTIKLSKCLSQSKILQTQSLAKQPDFLECLFELTNLKYYLFLEDYQNAFAYMCNIKKMVKTSYYLCSKVLQQKLVATKSNIEWLKWQRQTRNKLIQNNLSCFQTDQLFSNYFKDSNKVQQFLSFIPLSISLQIQLNKVVQWINNQMWIQRIFIILNPGQNITYSVQDVQKYSAIITNRLYDGLKIPKTKIPLKKIRSILLFFFQKLSHFKKKQLLESLSDLFILIGDNLNALKVRNFVLTIISSSLEYNLKCLLYYILDQQFGQFSICISIHFLNNIQQAKDKINEQDMFIYNLIQKIAEKCRQLSKSPYQLELLDSIYGLLYNLQGIIAEKYTKFYETVYRIRVRYANIYIDRLKTKIQGNHSNQKKLLFKNKLSHLKALCDPELNYRCIRFKIINHNFYVNLKKTSLRHFQNSKNIDLIRQFIQLYFQINQGNYNYMQPLTQLLLNQKTRSSKQIAFIFLQIRSDKIYVWNRQNQILLQICSVKKNLQNIYLKNDQKNKQIQFKQCENLVDHILNSLRQKVDQNIQEQIRRQRFYKLIQIANLVRCDYHNNQINSLQTFSSIYEFIKEQNSVDQNFKYLIRAQFIELLVHMIKLNPSQILQQLLLKTYQLKKSQLQILSIPNFFKQYIRIKNKKNMQDDNYNLIIRITKLLINNNKFNHSLPYICQTIDYFFSSLSSIYNRILLSRLQQQYNSIFRQFLESCYGCYFLFRLVSMCRFQQKKTQNYLFKISKCLSQCSNWVKRQILIKYYQFFVNYNKKKPRKLLICERLQTKHNTLTKNKMGRTIKRVINKQLSWPDQIKLVFNRKVSNFNQK